MTDPIQKTSSNPLPAYQTVTGQHDPLPPTGPEATKKAEVKQDQATTSFNDYLNQQQITTLEKAVKDSVFDPAAEISSSSTYQGSGQNGPI